MNHLQSRRTAGDFISGGSTNFFAFLMKGSSFPPKSWMVIPKAHLAIMAIVRTLISLLRRKSLDLKNIILKTWSSYSFSSIFPWFSAIEWKCWQYISVISFIWTAYCNQTNKNEQHRLFTFAKVMVNGENYLTRLIFPVVKVGVTAERTSFHAWSSMLLIK